MYSKVYYIEDRNNSGSLDFTPRITPPVTSWIISLRNYFRRKLPHKKNSPFYICTETRGVAQYRRTFPSGPATCPSGKLRLSREYHIRVGDT